MEKSNPHYRRLGGVGRNPLVITESEAQRLREAYLVGVELPDDHQEGVA